MTEIELLEGYLEEERVLLAALSWHGVPNKGCELPYAETRERIGLLKRMIAVLQEEGGSGS